MAQHNLGTVVRFEFLRIIRKKTFWVTTLVVPIVMGIRLRPSSASAAKAPAS